MNGYQLSADIEACNLLLNATNEIYALCKLFVLLLFIQYKASQDRGFLNGDIILVYLKETRVE